MKRLAFAVTALSIVGGSAFAADILPPPVPPPHAPAAYIPVAPPYDWSGFYVGGNLGAAWNSGGSVSDTFGSTFSGSGQTTKFVGGGQVGVNYEFWGGVVIGAEAMFDWVPNTSNTINVTNGGNTAAATINNRWLTTVTGKLGYAWIACCYTAKVVALLLALAVLELRSTVRRRRFPARPALQIM